MSDSNKPVGAAAASGSVPKEIPKVDSTALFRAFNPELYIKPNMAIMILGVAAFSVCSGYIAFLNFKTRKEKCYMSLNEDGSLTKRKKTSKWD